MQTQGCARCQHVFTLPGEPFPCFGCDAPTLCSRCAMDDVPLCLSCFAQQEDQQPPLKKQNKNESYKCTHCEQVTFSRLALETDRCPVKECERVWGCISCGVRRAEGLYCDLHSSSVKCQICHYQYPISGRGGYGALCACYGGEKKLLRYSCDLCMVKVRALMDTLLVLSHRKGQRLGRPIMDQILRYAIAALESEADQRVMRWSKLFRWQTN